MAQPDLRTKEGQLQFLGMSIIESDAIINYNNVVKNTVVFWDNIQEGLPEGPGKTRALHALNKAKFEMLSCIANEGA